MLGGTNDDTRHLSSFFLAEDRRGTYPSTAVSVTPIREGVADGELDEFAVAFTVSLVIASICLQDVRKPFGLDREAEVIFARHTLSNAASSLLIFALKPLTSSIIPPNAT